MTKTLKNDQSMQHDSLHNKQHDSQQEQCLIVNEQLGDYLDGLLSSDECRDFEAHLQACGDCQAMVTDMQALLGNLKELPMEMLPDGFEASLHEALERESIMIKENKSIKTNPATGQIYGNWKARFSNFKAWQKGVSYAAALFLVAFVGLNGMSGLMPGTGLGFNGTKSMDAMSTDMNYGAPEVGAESREGAVADGLQVAPAGDEKLSVTFNENQTLAGAKMAPESPVVAPDVALAETPIEPPPVAPASGETPTPQNQKLIKRAEVQIEVLAYKETVDKLIAQAQAMGGYVENSFTGTYMARVGTQDVSLKQGYLVLRVPTLAYETMVSSFEQYGKIITQTQSTEDVTAQYRDVYQEIKNLEVREKTLREIMGKAVNVTEIIEVERELSRVRGEINAYNGTLAGWDRLVDMSTLHINLTEVKDTTTTVNPPRKDLFGRAQEAFIQTINRMIVAFEALFIKVIGALPVILPVALVAGIGYGIYRKFKSRRAA